MGMLVLERKERQTLVINGNIYVTILKIKDTKIKIGIDAPEGIIILREELIIPQVFTKKITYDDLKNGITETFTEEDKYK
jgi:carbon storage regulator